MHGPSASRLILSCPIVFPLQILHTKYGFRACLSWLKWVSERKANADREPLDYLIIYIRIMRSGMRLLNPKTPLFLLRWFESERRFCDRIGVAAKLLRDSTMNTWHRLASQRNNHSKSILYFLVNFWTATHAELTKSMTYRHIGAATHRKRSKQCAQVHSVHCFVTDPSFYNIPHSHYTETLSPKCNEIGLKWKEIALHTVFVCWDLSRSWKC